MALRQKALLVAKSLVGVMEHGGNNRGETVTKIIRANGGTGPEPWCGDFVAFCYEKAGSKCVQRGWASTLQLGYLRGMGVIKYPRAGDIVVFDFPGGQSSDHTGLVVTYCNASGHAVVRRKATHIKTIEGNTGASGAVSDSTTGGDGVYEKVRSLSLVARYVRVYR